ncbi:MAG TPA: NUDIX domain-containing protein [Acidimicrobiales bacterium]|jgi:8-oxo-dGTP pyrophosphatase MutT (NUDIX family)
MDDQGRSAVEEFRSWLTDATTDAASPAIPAATVVLLRDRGHGVETLMMRKTSRIAFGGMWVFPGGRIDDEDRVGPDDLAAARRAASREAAEEADLVVPPESMVPLSFWVPPAQAPKRFATWFFVARAPEGDVTIDDGEITDHQWIHPLEAIAARDRGEVELAPPTWVTLHHLGRHDTVDDTMVALAHQRPGRYETRIASADGAVVTLWEGDAGYVAGDPSLPGPRNRLIMSDDSWRYERT